VYRHWRGLLYPRQRLDRSELEIYADRFDTVEVNNSFYRLPDRHVFEGWRTGSPKGFLFAVKASRYLTHMKKLRDPEEPLRRLMDSAAGLEEKLGPVLFQFPARWNADLGRLQDFVGALQRYPRHRFAFEFRHRSWLGPHTYRLLERAGAALCLPVAPDVPLDRRLTADWTYVRFHRGRRGIGIGRCQLEGWAERLDDYRRQRVDAYVYFNNDTAGHALEDAAMLMDLVGLARE